MILPLDLFPTPVSALSGYKPVINDGDNIELLTGAKYGVKGNVAPRSQQNYWPKKKKNAAFNAI